MGGRHGLILVIVASLANLFFAVPAVSLTISAIAVFIFSLYILHDVSNIVRGGETNYITATLNLFLDVYNIFISVLNLFVISVFWSFLLELFSKEQSRRLFGFIAAGGTAGAFLGPFFTDFFVTKIGINRRFHLQTFERGDRLHTTSFKPSISSCWAAIWRA